MKNKIVLFWLILLFSYAFPVYAGIRVEPTITQLSLSIGEEKSDFFTVTNFGDKAVLVEVELEELFQRTQGGEGIGVDSWLEVEPRRFEIPSGESENVKFKIKVPTGSSGELRAQVFFVTEGQAMGGIGIKNRFGVAIYVAIKGREDIEAEIKDISFSEIGPELDRNSGSEREIKIGVTVKNKGNVHIRPRGNVIIKDLEGKIIKELDLPYGYPIMPGEEHTYFTLWRDVEVLLFRSYKVSAYIQYGDIYNLEKNHEFQTIYSFK